MNLNGMGRREKAADWIFRDNGIGRVGDLAAAPCRTEVVKREGVGRDVARVSCSPPFAHRVNRKGGGIRCPHKRRRRGFGCEQDARATIGSPECGPLFLRRELEHFPEACRVVGVDPVAHRAAGGGAVAEDYLPVAEVE